MERIELVKEIKDLEIVNLLQISVDDNLNYIKKEEGLNVVGSFEISGLYENSNGVNKTLRENIKVDINVLYENIINSDQFKIYVDDFDYYINDGNLILRVYVKFSSYKDVDTTFPSTTLLEEKDSQPFIYVEEEKEVESDSIIIEKEKVKAESIPFLERFFNKNTYSTSASFHVLKENESIEDISRMYNVDVEELKNINREVSYQKGDLINIPLK